MDATSAAAWLRRMIDSLDTLTRACLLPTEEILRRNRRALVFVPTLHLRDDVSAEQRARMMEQVRNSLDTGDHDINDRRPRARWEPTLANRQLSRAVALAHRLTEASSAQRSRLELPRFIVQLAGRSAEVWYPRADGRPRLVFTVSIELTLNPADLECLGVTSEALQALWTRVVS